MKSRQNLAALCFLLTLASSALAKPINHARHLALDGNVANALSNKVVSGPFHARLRLARHHHARHQVNRCGTWTIQTGDTGNGIAIRLSISFAQLASLNPNVQWRNLQIGQVLNIPCPDGNTGSGTGSSTHIVVAGDTGNQIAAASGITFDLLDAYNPGVDWYNLQIGTVLIIPSPTMPTPTQTADMSDGTMPAITQTTTTGSTVTQAPTTAPLVITTTGVLYSNTTTTSTSTTTISDDPSSSAATTTDTSMQTGSSDDTSTFLSPPRMAVRARSTVPTSYTVKAGDTGYAIAAAYGITFNDLSSVNTGVNWTNLQVGQILQLPTSANVTSTGTTTSVTTQPLETSSSSRKTGDDVYILYSGSVSSQNYPDLASWLDFDTMWTSNLANIGTSCTFSSGTVDANTKDETNALRAAIKAVAGETRTNPSFILAITLQESNGCVRVPTTSSSEGIGNPGLMQDFEGNATCNDDGQQVKPCSHTAIKAMIIQGVKGNKGVGIVPGLKTAAKNLNTQWPVTSTSATATTTANVSATVSSQAAKRTVSGQASMSTNTVDQAMLYYEAARIYNSGSIPADGDLSGASVSTRCYVSDIVNRLLGWVDAQKACSLV